MPTSTRSSLEDFLHDGLRAMADRQLLRACRTLHPTTGSVIRHDGRELLHFASNDYLGLARDPRVLAAAHAALNVYGLGSGASRLMAGTSPLHQQLEDRLAQWTQREAALVFSSGYLTNLGVIPALVGPGDVVIADHANHASLIDACRLSRATLRIYDHADVGSLAARLAAARAARHRLIVTDGVFSMDGDVAPLPAIADLAAVHDAWLLVDDAHGGGVLGAQGRGSAEWLGVEARVDIHMGTLSKALGALGGYVAGSRTLIDHFVNRARTFIYSTALPPAVVAGALAALEIVEQEPQRRAHVLALGERLRAGLRAQGWDTLQSATQIVPVVVGASEDALRMSRALLAADIFAPAIRPPTVPQGSARIRLSVTAAHTTEHVDRCLEAFAALRSQARTP